VPEAERYRRSTRLLERLGLGDKLGHRPGQLSGGQQQRVSMARALMNGVRIILAEEPTGALDSQSGKEVMALRHELADADPTIILITHDRTVAAQARRVIEIRGVQIVGDTMAKPTRSRPGLDLGPVPHKGINENQSSRCLPSCARRCARPGA